MLSHVAVITILVLTKDTLVDHLFIFYFRYEAAESKHFFRVYIKLSKEMQKGKRWKLQMNLKKVTNNNEK